MVLFYFRACYGVLRFIMESGAKGCEVKLYSGWSLCSTTGMVLAITLELVTNLYAKLGVVAR